MVKERVATVLVWASAVLVSLMFFWILVGIAKGGAEHITWAFLTSEPELAGRAGGISTVIVATLLIVGVCMAVSIPIGVGTAALLAEFTPTTGLFGRVVRRSLDVLAGVPSIVFGLFGNAFFCKVLGMGFSILSGGLTLACMVLPILIRAAEEGFRSAPDELRFASAALGISRARTLWSLLLPAAAPGIVVGLVLGLGRAIGETAALIFTSGYVTRMPSSVMDSGRALSIHIYDLSMNVSGGDANAQASALVLITVLLVINLTASLVAGRGLRRRIVPV
jgi:phosphate transport system permease protein